jgi:hypothetical protein
MSKFEMNYLKDELESGIEKLDDMIERYISIKSTLGKNR